MQREVRRKDREISRAEANTILKRGEYGILSTVDSQGQPYGIPLNYACSGESIYFHCAAFGHKLENLSECRQVSFCVVGKTEVLPDKFGTIYESAIAFGSAYEVFNNEKHDALVLLLNKYSAGFINEGLNYIASSVSSTRVFRIDITSLTGKARR